MLDGLVFPGQPVERVAVEAGHEEKDPLRALPPAAVLLARREQPCGEPDRDWLPCPRSVYAQQFPDRVPQR